jgi:competence protein ComEC
MTGQIFYTVCIAFTSGIFLRSFFDMGVSGIIFLFLLALAFFTAGRLVEGRDTSFSLLALIFLMLSLGAFRLDYVESRVPSLQSYIGVEVSLEGRVAREPEVRETNVHLYVKPDGVEEIVLVTADRFGSELFRYGDRIVAHGTLEVPKAFETDGGRMFDYAGYLKARGVHTVLPFAEVEVVRRDDGSLLSFIYKQKSFFMETVERAIPEPEAGLGEGILLGVKRALGEDLEKTFRETGIIHIVVLSGYNVMIVVQAIMHVLSYVFFPRTRMFIGIMAIVVFALLVGLSATVVRASIMATLLLVAHTTGRIYAVLRALMLAGIAMLMLNPYLLMHDSGFQLSFLATLGLILLSPPIEKRLTRIPETFGIRGFVTATLATQLFVLPLLLYHTGLFSVVSLFVNVLVLPMVPVAMLLTFLTGVLGIVSHTLGILAGFLAHASLAYIINVAELFGAIPLASLSVSAFPFWIVVLSYGVMAGGIVRLLQNPGTKKATNDYEGWTIVEEKEPISQAHTVPKMNDTPFPFQ